MHHGIKKLLLLGAGHAHVQVLAQLARQRPADLDVTVLAPYPYQTYSAMVPGLVAGRYSEADCQIPLDPLIRAAGAKWLQGRCTGLDAAAQTVMAASTGKNKALPPELRYDLLSIDTGAVIDRQRLEADMPGAATPEWAGALNKALRDVRLPVRSVLARPEISLVKLLALEVGDIIPLGMPRHVPVTVAGRSFALGSIGEANGNAAIMIDHIEKGPDHD